MHLTATGDPDGPHLITAGQTTPAPPADGAVTETVPQAVAARDLRPADHGVDRAYPDADSVVPSHAPGIDLLGPVQRAPRWHAPAGQGFDRTACPIDWAQQQGRCPQGQPRRVWSPRHATEGNAVIPIPFDRGTCGSCGERRVGTQAAPGPRTRNLRPQAQHEALHAARTRQETKEFTQRYKRRAGIEGTISQGVHGFDLRYARYRGLAQTALQPSFVALAINRTRLIAWLAERPKAQPRPSRFAAAFQHAGMSPLPVS